MSLIDHACIYSSQWNFAVFPVHWIREDSTCSCRRENCRSAGKHPLTKDGVKSATKNLPQIERWWKEFPQANIGIATGKASGPGGIVVLDVDPRHGGFDSLAKLSLPGLETTMKCRTGGGGEHYYFRCPAGVEVRNSAGKLGAGLDVRGEGGYVVAPPSNHLMGMYQWEKWDEMAELPEEICNAGVAVKNIDGAVRLASYQPPEAGRIRDSPFETSCDGGVTIIPAGSRNNEMASLAGAMRRRGFSREAITEALLVENRQRCRPPLEEAEVREVAASISRYKSSAGVSPAVGEASRLTSPPSITLMIMKSAGGTPTTRPLRNKMRRWRFVCGISTPF